MQCKICHKEITDSTMVENHPQWCAYCYNNWALDAGMPFVPVNSIVPSRESNKPISNIKLQNETDSFSIQSSEDELIFNEYPVRKNHLFLKSVMISVFIYQLLFIVNYILTHNSFAGYLFNTQFMLGSLAILFLTLGLSNLYTNKAYGHYKVYYKEHDPLGFLMATFFNFFMATIFIVVPLLNNDTHVYNDGMQTEWNKNLKLNDDAIKVYVESIRKK